MSYFVKFIERIFWGVVGFGLMLVIFFDVLHILKNQSLPAVGAPVAAG